MTWYRGVKDAMNKKHGNKNEELTFFIQIQFNALQDFSNDFRAIYKILLWFTICNLKEPQVSPNLEELSPSI